MPTVDDGALGQRLTGARPQLVPRLLERHRVRPGIAGTESGEGAEQAACHADVRRLEPDVEVVIGARAVPLLPLTVRQPAKAQRVRTVEQAHAVLERQAFARVELPGDVAEPGLPNPPASSLQPQSPDLLV